MTRTSVSSLKFSLTANGVDVNYEGVPDEHASQLALELARALLNPTPPKPLRSRANGKAPANVRKARGQEQPAADSSDPAAADLETDWRSEIPFDWLRERTEQRHDHMWLVVTLAAACLLAGHSGIDHETADWLCDELGIHGRRRPAAWRSTFAAARRRGYLESAGWGVSVPTPKGWLLIEPEEDEEASIPQTASRGKQRGGADG